MDSFDCDIAVVGGGPGGYSAAAQAAARGLRVTLVERDRLGGVCLNCGCIPTKTMLVAAGTYCRLRRGACPGVVADAVRLDYGGVLAHRDAVVARLRGGVAQLLAAKKVAVLQGNAAFADPHALLVAAPDGTSRRLSFRQAIVATGSQPRWPDALPKSPRIVSAEAFLGLAALPARLLILGGGVIGCEYATLAAQFGVEVTLVEQRAQILPEIDDDARALLLETLAELGVRVVTGSPLSDVEADDEGVYGLAGGEEVYGDVLLVAAGRRPVTEGLQLAAAGIDANTEGIRTDALGRTSAPHIFAVGDVVRGSPLLAHVAMVEGKRAADALTGIETRAMAAHPACAFTSPEIAWVGQSEKEARAAGRSVTVEKSAFAYNGMAQAIGAARGFVKKIYEAESRRLLGAVIAGPHAAELILVPAREIDPRAPAIHPSLTESV